MSDTISLKPYLKWAGGKRQLLPEIRKHFPQDIETYYEPFVGAGAVFFALQPRNAVINDRNPQLMTTYRVIKEQVEPLIRLLREYERKNTEQEYYRIRNLDRDTDRFAGLSEVEQAGRFIFLNKTCYNGLYRVNGRGFFNVPYGNYARPVICEDALLRHISRYLNTNRVTILNEDFGSAVAEAHGFIYFDPPYHSPDKANFTAYQSGGFGEEEQIRLQSVFAATAGSGAYCLLSNADTPFIRELYKDFAVYPVQAKRPINSNAAGRGFVGEVLVRSW